MRGGFLPPFALSARLFVRAPGPLRVLSVAHVSLADVALRYFHRRQQRPQQQQQQERQQRQQYEGHGPKREHLPSSACHSQPKRHARNPAVDEERERGRATDAGWHARQRQTREADRALRGRANDFRERRERPVPPPLPMQAAAQLPWLPAEWICPDAQCGEVNTTRVEGARGMLRVCGCSACGTAFPGLRAWRCRCGVVNLPLEHECAVCSRPRSVAWECPSCRKVSDAHLLSCPGCRFGAEHDVDVVPKGRCTNCGVVVRCAGPAEGHGCTAAAAAAGAGRVCPVCFTPGSIVRLGNEDSTVEKQVGPATAAHLAVATQAPPLDSVTQRVDGGNNEGGGRKRVCSAPPSAASPTVAPASNCGGTGGSGDGGMAAEAMWSCALCGFQNVSTRVCCEQCLELRDDVAVATADFAGASGTSSDAWGGASHHPSTHLDTLPRAEAAGAAAAHAMWCCALCSATNPFSAEACTICGHTQPYRTPIRSLAQPGANGDDDGGAWKATRETPKALMRGEPRPALAPGHWECEKCGGVIGPLARTCDACGAARKLPPGTWQCERCLSVNKQSRLRCIGCHSHQSQSPHSSRRHSCGAREDNAGKTAQHGDTARAAMIPTAVNARPVELPIQQQIQEVGQSEVVPDGAGADEVTLWTCASCAFENHIGNATCLKCADARPEIYWRCPCTPSTFRRGSICGGCGGTRAGVWTCAVCFAPNSAGATTCVKCGESASTQQHERRICPSCRSVSDGERDFCAACGAVTGKTVWLCGNCTEVNSVTTDPRRCANCFEERRFPQPPTTPTRQQQQQQQQPAASRVLSFFWRCTSCKQRKTIAQRWCKECQVPMSDTAAEFYGAGHQYFPDTALWSCPECNRVNFDFELVCSICSTSRPEHLPADRRDDTDKGWPYKCERHQGTTTSATSTDPERSGAVRDEALMLTAEELAAVDNLEKLAASAGALPSANSAEPRNAVLGRGASVGNDDLSVGCGGSSAKAPGRSSARAHQEVPRGAVEAQDIDDGDDVGATGDTEALSDRWVCATCGERNVDCAECGCCGVPRM